MTWYLNEIRTKRGLSLRQLAQLSGVAKSHIEEIEAGNGNPTAAVICKLAKALGVPAADLFRCD